MNYFLLSKSISYPNNKTKHLIGMANTILEKFNVVMPMTVEELVQLPGVGRKTANVITSVVDQQPSMAVDTHVFQGQQAHRSCFRSCDYPLSRRKAINQRNTGRTGA